MEATSETHPIPVESAAVRGATEARDDGAARGALPNLIVIGAQKCGTSALHFYLGLHPEISMSEPKELNFFIKKRNWDLGLDWYRQHFDPRAAVRGESSPNYTAYPSLGGVARRMHAVVPEAKLIYLVRDPLERIAAHWVHNYAKGRIDHPLGEQELRKRKNYVSRSRYHFQLRRYVRRYSLDRILVLDQDDLRHRRAETLRGVFEFAEVDPGFSHPSFRREQNRTQRKVRATRLGERLGDRRSRSGRHLLSDRAWAVLSSNWPLGRRIDTPDVREALPEKVLTRLREDAERFRELTGREFAHWTIWDT
jgi:hypothetical protein